MPICIISQSVLLLIRNGSIKTMDEGGGESEDQVRE